MNIPQAHTTFYNYQVFDQFILRLAPAERPTCVKHLTAGTHPNRRVLPIMAHEFHFEVNSESKPKLKPRW